MAGYYYINNGSKTIEDLSYDLQSTYPTIYPYAAPEKDYYPMDVVTLLEKTVYHPETGAALTPVRVYKGHNEYGESSCVYIELEDSMNRKYYYAAYNTQDLDYFLNQDNEIGMKKYRASIHSGISHSTQLDNSMTTNKTISKENEKKNDQYLQFRM